MVRYLTYLRLSGLTTPPNILRWGIRIMGGHVWILSVR